MKAVASRQEGTRAMTNKRIGLPKEGSVEPDQRSTIDGDTDVEGHGSVNPAPSDFSKRTPSRGGEAIPTDEEGDVPDHHRA
jgi:hypothetical protein